MLRAMQDFNAACATQKRHLGETETCQAHEKSRVSTTTCTTELRPDFAFWEAVVTNTFMQESETNPASPPLFSSPLVQRPTVEDLSLKVSVVSFEVQIHLPSRAPTQERKVRS